MHHRFRIALAASGCFAALLAAAATTPQGPPLPAAPAPFTGRIGTNHLDSTPAYPAPGRAPRGAPNVLLVLTDDVGFGAASTFGGPVPTPNLDRLAARGLVYSHFHTTGMCSPTRAALLTGRNHHAVANGIVANLSTGYPGYHNLLPRSAATLAEVLRQNGYGTAMFGKHHNAPEDHVSAQGPFDLWPTGLGFEYFYGFMAAQTNQFTPALYRGVSPVPTLRSGLLDEALADDAIGWVRNHRAVDPDKPFFIYYATGSTHAPLQAPAERIAAFRGRFDEGWDAVRAATVARQVRRGFLPQDAHVTPRPPGIPAWSSLTPDQRRITARMMEVYAAMLSHQDEQFGRLVDEIERMGEADDTLVLFIEGDNGAAAEGGFFGSLNPMSVFANGTRETQAQLLADLDRFGGPETSGNYAHGWAWAMNAPNPYVKSYASHLGGVRNGLVVSWPDRIEARGTRTQFGHVVDIVPTVLEAAGIEAPSAVNGVAQQPIDGVSLVHTFDDPRAPERRQAQYFEMLGNRAIYHAGWWANTTPMRIPWGPPPPEGLSPADYQWELYDLRSDPAQARDLALSEPARLAQMQRLFDEEARRNGVYPLDDRLGVGRFGVAAAQHPPREYYTYWGAGVSVPAGRAAPLLGRSFTIEADIELPDGHVTGTVLALGSRFGGWSFHLLEGRPTAVMAASQFPDDQFAVAAADALPAGRTRLEFEFRYDGGRNAGGTMTLRADGRDIASGRIARTITLLPELSDTLDVGFDAATPVVAGPASGPFGGGIRRVDVIYPRTAAATGSAGDRGP